MIKTIKCNKKVISANNGFTKQFNETFGYDSKQDFINAICQKAKHSTRLKSNRRIHKIVLKQKTLDPWTH